MAVVAPSQLDQPTHDQLCCTYAALILHDDGQEVTAAKINKLVETSQNKVEKFWPILFARTLGGRDISSLVFATGSAPAAAVSSSTVSAAATETKVEKKVEKKAEEEHEEVEGAMDLFGGDDY